jgi:hypothetical protein
MQWTVALEAATIDDLHVKLANAIDTGALEVVLAQRYANQGKMFVVQPLQSMEQVVDERVKEAKADKRAKADKIIKEATEKPKKAAKPAPEPEPEPEQTDWVDDNEDKQPGENAAVEGGDVTTELTVEDVRAALEDFRKKHGLVTARQIMLEEGGSSKLVDIPAANYRKLIAALEKHAEG